MFNEEQEIKSQIRERLKNAPRFYLYCSVCAGYLCCSTYFQKYIVHFDCRHAPIKYYNQENQCAPAVDSSSKTMKDVT